MVDSVAVCLGSKKWCHVEVLDAAANPCGHPRIRETGGRVGPAGQNQSRFSERKSSAQRLREHGDILDQHVSTPTPSHGQCIFQEKMEIIKRRQAWRRIKNTWATQLTFISYSPHFPQHDPRQQRVAYETSSLDPPSAAVLRGNGMRRAESTGQSTKHLKSAKASSSQPAQALPVPLSPRPTRLLADKTSSSDSPPVLGNPMLTKPLGSGFQWSLDVVPSSGDQGTGRP